LWVHHDITERKMAEEQILQFQKMESVGRLAGGIAHDFNNVLTAIIGYSQLAMLEASAESNLSNHVQEIQKAAERAANLTSQLLAFSRRQVIEPKVINLNDLILDLDRLVRRLIGENIELVTLPSSDLGAVKVDPNQMEQVLVNLVVNARDAMPTGGKLVIETRNAILDARYAQQHAGAVPGQYALLSVTDRGVGMSEEVKAHLFEPFFTTKEVGKGTGLGLATCYGIIKQNGGQIEVQSEPGQGTNVKIYLPCSIEVTGTYVRDEQTRLYYSRDRNYLAGRR
jgi:two-component system, cell cycle sensor histidine kinase and response regulator CckA